jgi:hypothetical protein
MNKFIIFAVLCCIGLCWSAPASEGRVVEGDIRLPLGKSLALNGNKRWAGGVVPYAIDSNSYTTSEISLIKAAMAMITSKTGGCITFVPRVSQANWIQIRKLSGCWSYIGMISYMKPQEVSLGDGCLYKGTVVHELGHAIGFYHEQNRPDRDEFVKISFQNVDADQTSNFEKYSEGITFSTPYDYNSIMHYGNKAFSNNGKETISPLQPNIKLMEPYDRTDAQILTAFDIQAIRARYSCNGPTPAPTVAPATVPPTVAPPSSSCVNADSSCMNYESNKDTYCSTAGTRWSLNGVLFVDACKKMCGICTAPVSSCKEDLWFCPQFPQYYCETSSVLYSVNGIPFPEACPQKCNVACAKSNVEIKAPKGHLLRMN